MPQKSRSKKNRTRRNNSDKKASEHAPNNQKKTQEKKEDLALAKESGAAIPDSNNSLSEKISELQLKKDAEELKTLELQNSVIERNIAHRESMRKFVMYSLIVYSVFTAAVMFLAGWSDVTCFELDTPVLVTIAGSTAVAAIGLVNIVVKGLFEGINKNDSK